MGNGGRLAHRPPAPQGAGGHGVRHVKDEEGGVQLILCPQVFQRHRGDLQSNSVLACGTVSCRDAPLPWWSRTCAP